MSRGTHLQDKEEKRKESRRNKRSIQLKLCIYAFSAIFRVSIDGSHLMHEDTDAWIASEKPYFDYLHKNYAYHLFANPDPSF